MDIGLLVVSLFLLVLSVMCFVGLGSSLEQEDRMGITVGCVFGALLLVASLSVWTLSIREGHKKLIPTYEKQIIEGKIRLQEEKLLGLGEDD